MQVVSSPRRFGNHANAFGFLRLLLASLVILSHTPELADGNRKREILTRLFHTISFGEFAVDGFFVVSGFLIAASYLNGTGPMAYLRKRVIRIFPGFVVSSTVCLLIVGPLAGGRFPHSVLHGLVIALSRVLILCPPTMADAFAGTPYPLLNGAAWTIQFEFLCYVLILILGLLGLLRSVRLIAVVALACLLLSGFPPPELSIALNWLPLHSVLLQGDRMNLVRLIGMFLAGTTFYLVQGSIRLSAVWAAAAFGMLGVTLSMAPIANLGFAVFGSYLVFAIAALGSETLLVKINNRNDISYGLYLYAWPVEKLLLWWHVTDNLLLVGVATWVLAAGAGTLSWFLVEKPAMRWARSKKP